MIKERYAKHTFSLNIEKHPSFIKESTRNARKRGVRSRRFWIKR